MKKINDKYVEDGIKYELVTTPFTSFNISNSCILCDLKAGECKPKGRLRYCLDSAKEISGYFKKVE